MYPDLVKLPKFRVPIICIVKYGYKEEVEKRKEGRVGCARKKEKQKKEKGKKSIINKRVK